MHYLLEAGDRHVFVVVFWTQDRQPAVPAPTKSGETRMTSQSREFSKIAGCPRNGHLEFSRSRWRVPKSSNVEWFFIFIEISLLGVFYCLLLALQVYPETLNFSKYQAIHRPRPRKLVSWDFFGAAIGSPLVARSYVKNLKELSTVWRRNVSWDSQHFSLKKRRDRTDPPPLTIVCRQQQQQ